MEIYPSSLPKHPLSPYSGLPPYPELSTTPFDAGIPRKRTVHSSGPRPLQFKLKFTVEEYATFEAFLITNLNGGEAWFQMPILEPGTDVFSDFIVTLKDGRPPWVRDKNYRVIVTMDLTVIAAVSGVAPILSGATGIATILTIAGQVSTTVGNGILYGALVEGLTPPSDTAIIAGVGFVDAGNQAVGSAGVQLMNLTAALEGTDHSLHFVQEDISLNRSNVASSGIITTGSSALSYNVITALTRAATQVAVGASQGVETNGTWFWTTGDDGIQTTILVFNSSWTEQVSEAQDTTLDFASHNQVNHIYVDRPNDKLYVGASNFPTTPALGWIFEYDINTSTGGLTFVAAHSVGAEYCEGGTIHNSNWWVCFHSIHEIHRYSLDLTTLEKTYSLALVAPNLTEGRIQGCFFKDEVIYVNYHGSTNDPKSISSDGRMDAYVLDPTADELIPVSSRIEPPVDCNQGIALDGTDLYMAERTGNNQNTANNVVRATFTTSAARKITGPRLIDSAEAFDHAAVNSLSIPAYLAKSGTDRLAIVFATWETAATPTAQGVLTFKWGGVDLTLLGEYFNDTDITTHNAISVWMMKEADIPATAQDIDVVLKENLLSAGNDFHMGLGLFKGVNQISTTEGLAVANALSVNVTTSGSNRTLISIHTNGNIGLTGVSNEQILVLEETTSDNTEFESIMAIKDAETAGVYALGVTHSNTDREITVGLAIK